MSCANLVASSCVLAINLVGNAVFMLEALLASRWMEVGYMCVLLGPILNGQGGTSIAKKFENPLESERKLERSFKQIFSTAFFQFTHMPLYNGTLIQFLPAAKPSGLVEISCLNSSRTNEQRLKQPNQRW